MVWLRCCRCSTRTCYEYHAKIFQRFYWCACSTRVFRRFECTRNEFHLIKYAIKMYFFCIKLPHSSYIIGHAMSDEIKEKMRAYLRFWYVKSQECECKNERFAFHFYANWSPQMKQDWADIKTWSLTSISMFKLI